MSPKSAQIVCHAIRSSTRAPLLQPSEESSLGSVPAARSWAPCSRLPTSSSLPASPAQLKEAAARRWKLVPPRPPALPPPPRAPPPPPVPARAPQTMTATWLPLSEPPLLSTSETLGSLRVLSCTKQHLRRALAVPEAQRDADVRSFLAAHAALEAAADALQEPEARSAGASAQGSSSGGSASSQGGSASSQGGSSAGSEERRLLATAAYLTATWATATTRGLRHPRLAEAHGPPLQVNQLLWQTVASPCISMNLLFWLPAPSVTLPNEDAKHWAAPGALHLNASRLLLLLLLADAMSVGMGAAGALHFLAARAQRSRWRLAWRPWRRGRAAALLRLLFTS